MAKIQDIRSRTKRTNGTRNLSQIKYIVRHHSATDTGHFDSFWRHWNGTLGWGTGGYAEIILRDGTVQLCYDPHEITNGAAGQNTASYHICLVGNGSFTAAQEKAWDERVAYNMKRLGVGVNNVKGHREMPGQNTSCPGVNMNSVRARIKGGNTSAKPAPAKPSAKPQTSAPKASKPIAKGTLPNATYYVKNKPNERFNGSGVRAVQEALASVHFYPNKGAKNNGIDGWYGPDTADAVRRFQLMNGLKADGVYGPATQKVLERVRKK